MVRASTAARLKGSRRTNSLLRNREILPRAGPEAPSPGALAPARTRTLARTMEGASPAATGRSAEEQVTPAFWSPFSTQLRRAQAAVLERLWLHFLGCVFSHGHLAGLPDPLCSCIGLWPAPQSLPSLRRVVRVVRTAEFILEADAP